MLVVFVRTELRSPDPMMDVRVFMEKVYTTAPDLRVFADALLRLRHAVHRHAVLPERARLQRPRRPALLMLAMTIPTIVLSPITGRIVAAHGGRGPDARRARVRDAGPASSSSARRRRSRSRCVGLAFVGAAAGLGRPGGDRAWRWATSPRSGRAWRRAS